MGPTFSVLMLQRSKFINPQFRNIRSALHSFRCRITYSDTGHKLAAAISSDGVLFLGVFHLAGRAVTAIGRPLIGKEFADLMALGCQVITRFDDIDSVYLTIDDSPNPISTLSILNELAKQEVHATFFCIGWRAVRYPDLVRKILSAGHEIGNHSMHHPNLWRVSPWRLRKEVAACQDALQSTCEGSLRINAFRAPYGNFRWDLRFVKRLGLEYFVKWDVAPSCDKPDSSAMAEYILENTRPGSIILLHDGLEGEPKDRAEAIGKASSKCISIIVPKLKSRGLQFKVISQNELQAYC
jgi:chitooligosaccharide deacetylase